MLAAMTEPGIAYNYHLWEGINYIQGHKSIPTSYFCSNFHAVKTKRITTEVMLSDKQQLICQKKKNIYT